MPEERLTIVGDGPLRTALEARAARLGIAERVDFRGVLPKPEVAELMRRARVVAVPSRFETSGVVAIEALASGTPVVASRVGALPELLAGGGGTLVSPGDAAALADALVAAQPDDVSQAVRARHSREHVGAELIGDLPVGSLAAMTRVAVVIPCFNDGATVGDAIASLANEEPHELVVVDDGSTDEETLAVLAGFEADGVRVVRRPNGGLSAARMTGVEETTAPYIFPLDADDLLVPGALARLADALDADPGSAVAWGDLDLFGAFELHVETAAALDPWELTYVSEIPGTSLVRRTALLAAGGWSLARGYEDWDLWLALAGRGWRGTHVPSTVLRVRQGQSRLNAAWLERHGDFVSELRRRHEQLWGRRRETRRTSPAPQRAKLLFPLIDRLPMSDYDRFRLTRLARHPVRLLRARRAR